MDSLVPCFGIRVKVVYGCRGEISLSEFRANLNVTGGMSQSGCTLKGNYPEKLSNKYHLIAYFKSNQMSELWMQTLGFPCFFLLGKTSYTQVHSHGACCL